MRYAKIILPVLACAATAAMAAVAPPPATPAGSDFDTVQGAKIPNPYHWLEDAKDPKVEAWSDAQNARTRAYLDALPGRAAIKAKLMAMTEATSPSYFQITARGQSVFALYSDPKFQQPRLVTLNAAADPTSRKILIDPNAMDAKGLTAIDWYVPSGDGTKVAVSLSKGGSEDGTLHLYDTATGKEIDKPIAGVQYPTAGGSMAWAMGGKGFWYTRYPGPSAPAADQHFNMEVYFHTLGADPKTDTLALGKADGLERISEIFLDNRFDRPWVLTMVQRGDGNTWAYYVLKPGAPALQIGTYADDVVYATMGADDAVYGISRRNSSNGKIVKLKPPFAKEGLATAPILVPESDLAIQSGGAEEHQADLGLSKDRLFVRDVIGGPNDVRIFGLDGKAQGKLPLPDIASNDEVEALADGSVMFDVATYLRPRYFARWNPATGKTEETGLKIVSPISFADTEVTRAFATSKDGTKVPVNIIMKKGAKLDGANPALLYGYGGFGINQSPYFAGGFVRSWLDGGGIYAIANIRGGSEYGESWHQNGMLTRKQNVFDDFAAAGQYLVDQHYTSHDKLALRGGSNGGLLMGAMLTQHPGLARAVDSIAGVYDMVAWGRDNNGVFTATEYGAMSDPVQAKALLAYSPYQHVAKGTAYPAVMMSTGANDGRVNPLQSRKFAAALQAATSSGHPVLLRTSKNAGHGIGSSLDERVGLQTDELTFLFDQLGVKD
jgi:prolyl oligopeptidase